MVIKYPCSVCSKSVRKNDRAVFCDVCNFWVHIKCNNITPSEYKNLKWQDNTESFICISSLKENLPFSFISDECLKLTAQNGLNIDDSNLENINFTLNRNEKKTIKQITNLIIENSDPENENSKFCQYYSINEFCDKKFEAKNNFSLFHLNIHSLQFHIEELTILLNMLNYNFDVLAISETKLYKGIQPAKDINIPSYQCEQTPTEANKGGTLLYIADKLNYKPRKDLEIYEPKKIESTFIEIINSKGKNTLVGCIYKHHNISEIEYNEIINPLIYKLNTENKPCWIIGDFNMDLLKIEKNKSISDYFDIITHNNFMPLITLPTIITNSY